MDLLKEPGQTEGKGKKKNIECCHGECLGYMNYMNLCEDENQRMKGPLINVLKKWLDIYCVIKVLMAF